MDSISITNVYTQIYLSSAQTVSSDTWTDVNFDAIEHDDWELDPARDEYKIPETGTYLLTGKVEVTGIGQGNYLALRFLVNGTIISRHFTHETASATISSSVSSVGVFNEGDILGTEVYQNSGSSLDLETGEKATYLHLAKIG